MMQTQPDCPNEIRQLHLFYVLIYLQGEINNSSSGKLVIYKKFCIFTKRALWLVTPDLVLAIFILEGAMNYSEVFSNAWKIVWKFKAFWIFGILSSCMRSGGGSSGSGGSSGGGSSLVPGQGNLASPSLDFPGTDLSMAAFLPN